MMADDVVIPIVFPDYVIAMPKDMIFKRPGEKIDLPKRLNDWGIPDFKTPDIQTPTTVPQAGHAGVLFINGASGLTRYYEYGRYEPSQVGVRPTSPPVPGLVWQRNVPNVRLAKGEITMDSLKAALQTISKQSGHGGRIAAAYIKVPGKFAAMDAYATKRKTDNTNAKRDPYSITGNSCVHFMRYTVEAAGVSMPMMIDPRPKSYIEEIRDDHPDLDYSPGDGKLTIK